MTDFEWYIRFYNCAKWLHDSEHYVSAEYDCFSLTFSYGESKKFYDLHDFVCFVEGMRESSKND